MVKFHAVILLVTIVSPFSVESYCTNWIDRDNPSGAGDFETVPHQIPRTSISGIIKICPTSYEIQAKSGSQTFTNAAQILAAFGLEVGFDYPTSGLVVGRSGFYCDWRRPTNRGKPRRDFSIRYCCVRPVASQIEPCYNCTQWFDRDNPGGIGDWELAGHSSIPTSSIKCKNYMIQVKDNSLPANVMTNSAQVLAMTGNYATFLFPASGFSNAGFLCTNLPHSGNPALPTNQNQRCKDFSVRFCCQK